MSGELKVVVGRFERVEMVAKEHAAREVGACDTAAGIAERKQMMRKVPVRPDVRQPV